MSKIYLAAPFGDKFQMQKVRDQLQKLGHEVTSQWIDVEHTSDQGATEEEMNNFCMMDVCDVQDADILIAFSRPRNEPSPGGGRHVEYGIAMMLDKHIIVVGPRGEHIFHRWPGVLFFATVDELLLYRGL